MTARKTVEGAAAAEESGKVAIVKKYANRRLYNTATSSYVTLDELSRMVRDGEEFVVYDAKTGEDITRSVLAQIIFEQENKEGQNLLPINFLRQLIRFYGDSMQMMVPRYLEVSLDSLTKEQEKFRGQLAQTFGGGFGAIEEQVRRNMEMFERAFAMFAPFARQGSPTSQSSPSSQPSGTEKPASTEKPAGGADEIGGLSLTLQHEQPGHDDPEHGARHEELGEAEAALAPHRCAASQFRTTVASVAPTPTEVTGR